MGEDRRSERLAMTRVRATCPSCGEMDLPASEVVLRRSCDVDGRVLADSSYRFRCPGCADVVEKPADERVVDLLITGGVPIEDVGAVRRGLHPEMPDDGPAFTLDDLLDLHIALAEPDWFDRLAALTPR
jgi:predicted RNA-binding Zn-ribbon protein involved in translation (DUF1610 family)